MNDNVTQLPGTEALPENPIGLAPRPFGCWCQHPSIVIDEHDRSIRCADLKCGAVLDPFDYLRTQAHVLSRAWDNHRHVSGQAHEIAERVHALKKEEARLRDRIKRLQDKAGAVVVVRGKETP